MPRKTLTKKQRTEAERRYFATLPDPKTLTERQTEAARRYFDVWKAEGEAVLTRHAREAQQLVALLEVSDLDALRALRKDSRADPFAGQTDERKMALGSAFYWMDVDDGNFGGPLGMALFGPHFLCPIASTEEIDELLAATPERLRAWPPVVIANGAGPNAFQPIVFTSTGYKAADASGPSFTAVVAALAENDPASPEVRKLYHTFARDVWAWHELQSPLSPNPIANGAVTIVAPHVPDLEGEEIQMHSSYIERGMFSALSAAQSPKREELFPIRYDDNGRLRAAFRFVQRTAEVEVALPAMIAQEAYDKLSKYDELTSDVFFALFTFWYEQRGEDNHAWITPEAILNLRDRKPRRQTSRGGTKYYTAGHRTEDRAEIIRCITQLEELWFKVKWVKLADKTGKASGFINQERHYFKIDSRSTWTRLDGSGERILAWKYKLDEAVYALGGDRQFTAIVRKVFEYDPVRELPEKRLAKHFAFWLAISRPKPCIRKIQTIFDDTHLPIDDDRPNRVKDRFEKAMKRLTSDGAIGGWRYGLRDDGKRFDPKTLPARKYLKTWLAWKIEVDPLPAKGLGSGHVADGVQA